MSIKIEPRGKISGVKIHLTPVECVLYMSLAKNPVPQKYKEVGELSLKIGKKIAKLQDEFPNLLKERTKEEIKAELENEFESAKQKLSAMGSGKDWKEVKVAK